MKSRPAKKRPPPVRPHSSRRIWAFRLTALLLPPGLLAALELGLRLAGYGYDPHFFKHVTIGSEDYLVQNDSFSLQFFPPETARTPGPLRMPARKAPGTFRIFIFGESAAMGDPEPAYGAGRYLEMLLRSRYPATHFEIVNVAFTAINSHVIVPLARECAAQDGDLWIIYMGNNEMVGPYGAATVFGRRAPALPYVRLVTAVQRTRTGQLIQNWSRKLGRGEKAAAWGGMHMFLQNEIPPDSPMKEMVYRNFAKNLDDIVRAGTRAGAKVLLNTVAVNLRDCPPFASLGNRNLPPADRVQLDTWTAAASRAARQNDFATATRLCAQAAGLDATSAGLQFDWGRCLLAQTNVSAAREHLQAACDDDALPFRTDARLNALIRAEWEKAGGPNLILLDAATELATTKPDGLCGQETFYEHVHFDFDGSYRLALAWAKQIAPLLPASPGAWASQPACEQMLGLSDWNRALVLEHMVGRLQVPPFSNQAGNDQRMARLAARARAVHDRMDAGDAARARENFGKQLAAAPDDYLLHENYALFLQATGDGPGALAEWRLVHALLPQDFLAWFQMGRMLGGEGQWDEAEADLHQALNIRPGLTEAWIELGNVQASRDDFTNALASYDTALAQHAADAETRCRRGQVLARLDRHAAAIADYRLAIQLNPADWQPHFQLGGELDAAGQLDGAREEFGAAARLNPDNGGTHFNYGVLLAKQNRFAEARHEFEETLRLEPNHPTAQKYLDAVRAMQPPAR